MPEETKLHRFIYLLCGLAALRVMVYLAAFPFFSNVDEIFHFDLAMRYHNLDLPTGTEALSGKAAFYMAGCCSPEYISENLAESRPMFSQSPTGISLTDEFKAASDYWRTVSNYEYGAAPLYYLVVAIWVKPLMLAGVDRKENCMLLYWIRLLNAFVAAALVWVTYRAARLTFPNSPFLQFTAALFVTVMPQDTFYCIQSDVLSPLLFGLAYIALLNYTRQTKPVIAQAARAGGLVALTVLVKLSSLPLLILALLWPLMAWYKNRYAGSGTGDFAKAYVVFAGCALLPFLLWLWHNANYLYDFTGSAQKIHYLGWTIKEPHQWLNSVLLSADKFWLFIKLNIASYWRGELVWNDKRLAMESADNFYIISTLVFLPVAVYFGGRKNTNGSAPVGLPAALACFLALFAYMFVLSLVFKFPEGSYPSAAEPYFASGRLMSASLVPFILLYTFGFECSLFFLKNPKHKLAVVLFIALCILVSEVVVTYPVFGSHYNFYALAFNL